MKFKKKFGVVLSSVILVLAMLQPVMPITDSLSRANISGTEITVQAAESIPKYSGKPYVVLKDNEPDFTDKQKKSTKAFETYSKLDALGRCGTAFANICPELMPTSEREDISSVHPSGWKSKMGWERCHLIGFQLAGENANEKNLITGTHYFNVTGMLPFENMVDDYVDETGNHVLYRVTPVYSSGEPVARGVKMEAWSVEDEGDGICFHVYVFNVQPGKTINYKTGVVTDSTKQKAEQKISGGTYKKSFKYTAVKKEAKSFTIGASSTAGKVSYKKTSGSSSLSVNSSGKVSVKKGTKAGSYTMKVKVSAAETSKYRAASVTKTVTVQVTDTSASSAAQSSKSVWKSATGSKYHSKNDCGNMNPDKAVSITEKEAKEQGLEPCSKCW